MHSIPPEKERALLREAAGGDEQSFAELFYAYKDKLYAFVLRISGSPETTEDVLQDVFMKIWVDRQRLTEVVHFNAFIYRVCHNHTLNLLRRMSRETLVRIESGRHQEAGDPVDEAFMYNHIRKSLAEIVDKLPPQQKTVYQLSREESVRQDEIARQMGISISTVKNHLAQALKTIREKLAQYHINPVVWLLITLFGALIS